MYYNNECIICMDDRFDNDYIKMPCCNTIIHESCIRQWIINNNDTNSEINRCIYCKQITEFYNNIIYSINIERPNYIYIDVSNTLHENSYNIFFFKYIKIFYTLTIIIFFFLIIPIIISNN